MSTLKDIVKNITNAGASWIYFDERAQALLKKPSLTRNDLAYVSSRDYRVWPDAVYDDMIDSYVTALGLSGKVSILELGCAAGFIALGISPKVREYIGVDLSPACLRIARRLNLPNARFVQGSGAALPVPDGSVDRVLCADVFVNIPDPSVCRHLLAAMARVTVPGGKILVATLNDATTSKAAFEQRIEEFVASLPPYVEDPELSRRKWMPWRHRLSYNLRRKLAGITPDCAPSTEHEPQSFVSLGKDLGLTCEILPIHQRHPYHGFRFNALFTKKSA